MEITIMQCRYDMLKDAIAGYNKTGMPLVSYSKGTLGSAGFGDDVGIYYFIPKIAHTFNLSLNQSINIFFISMALISLVLGIIGSFLLFKTWWGRAIALIGMLALTLVSIRVGDVYIASASIVLMVIPIFLYLVHSKKNLASLAMFIFLAGTAVGVVHFIRSHAGTAVLIFILFVVMFYMGTSWKNKLTLTALLVAGVLVPSLYFNVLLDQRDAYLVEKQPGYHKVTRQHPFWHSVYIGFGFLDNPYGIKYLDAVAADKVRSISPKTPYLSREYEAILKYEVFKLIRQHRRFVITTLFAKLGVIILYVLTFANIGLLASIKYPKNFVEELAFWGAMGFSSLYGLLVIPNTCYLLGLVAFATVYGIVSINHAIEQGAWQDIKAFSSRIGGRLKSVA
ncbi:MAG: hypothetical protein AB1743_00445 [Actinomycetota bacterium]